MGDLWDRVLAKGESLLSEINRSRGVIFVRLHALLRRAFNEGVAWLVLASLLFGFGALLLRSALLRLVRFNEVVASDITGILLADQEPRLEQSSTGAVSAVFSRENRKPRSETDLARTERPVGEFVRTAFLELVEEALEYEPGGALKSLIDTPVGEEARALADIKQSVRRRIESAFEERGVSFSPTEKWMDRASIRIREAARVRNGIHANVYEPRDLGTFQDRGRFSIFGPLWRLKSDESENPALAIPSFHAAGNRPIPPSEGSGTEKEGPGSSPENVVDIRTRTDRRIDESVAISGFLDDSIDLLNDLIKAGSLKQSSAFVQAYFISPDSVLRIWRRGGLPNIEDELEPTRLYAATNYFQEFLRDEQRDTHWTNAYIDYGGHGVVRTICSYVPGRMPNEMLGIVCTDYALERSWILGNLVPSEILDVESLDLEFKDGKLSGVVKEAQRFVRPTEARVMKPARRAAIEASIKALGDRRDARRATQRITPLDVGIGQSFLVPAGTRGSTLQALLITPKAPRPDEWTLLALVSSIVCLGLGFGAVVNGAKRARDAAAAEARLAVYRALQVGVITVDSNDYIEEANDRAEELLGVILTKAGAAVPERKRHKFEDLVEDDVIDIDDHGRHGERIGYRSEVKNRRERGKTSTYFAKLKTGSRRGLWIRVSGSPIISCSTSGDVIVESYGVITPVRREKGVLLDAHRSNASR